MKARRGNGARRALGKTLTGLLWAAFGGILVLPVFYVGSLLRDPSLAGSHFELRSIRYEGLVHLARDELDRRVRSITPSHTLSVDLDRLRGLVESEPWVREAVVRRRLPDRIDVFIEERVPVAVAAVDGELHVVDVQGVVLDRFGPDYREIDGPIVAGLRNVERENTSLENERRMRVYLRVLSELRAGERDYTSNLSEIDVSEPDRVGVVPLDEPVRVFLGEGDYRRRFQLFLSRIDLYQQLKEEHGSIRSVDVTFDDRIIFHTSEGASGRKTVRGDGRSS